MNTDHPSVRRSHPAVLSYYFGEVREVHIDRGLVVLVEYLWRNDVRTLTSCQEYPDRFTHIQFPTAADLEKAVRLCYELAPRELHKYARMLEDSPYTWRVDVWPKLGFPGTQLPIDGPGPLYYALRFPAVHLPILTERIPAQDQ